jgi:hypothetical protein
MARHQLPLRGENLIRPAVIHVLNGEVDLVGTVVTVGEDKAVSQGVQAVEPMRPLRLPVI